MKRLRWSAQLPAVPPLAVPLLAVLLLAGAANAFQVFNCALRTSSTFQFIGATFDSYDSTLYLVSRESVFRVKNVKVDSVTPLVVQIGEVEHQPHGLNLPYFESGRFIGVFMLGRKMYLVSIRPSSTYKDADFRLVKPSIFELLESEGDDFEMMRKHLDNVTVLGSYGDSSLVTLSGPKNSVAKFLHFDGTGKQTSLSVMKTRNMDLQLVALAELKRKQTHEAFYLMVGFTGKPDVVLYATTTDLNQDTIQYVASASRAVGCYRTLCEGGQFEGIVFDDKLGRHLLIVDGGLVAVNNLDQTTGTGFTPLKRIGLSPDS